MRWLNFDGIGTGPLADQAGSLQRQLWELFADEQARSDRISGITGSATKRMLRELGVDSTDDQIDPG